MAGQQEPTIRPYVKASDDKLVLFMIGKAHMEPLAVANRKGSIHPYALFIWITLSSIFMQLMRLQPKTQYGVLGYLVPLPAFAISALPIVFLLDWFNRPEFESDTKKTLASEDIVTLESYYKRSPASGFWLLDYGDKFIGLIAVDAPKPRTSKKSSDEVPTYATIRHFYVQEPYRGISMQTDLLLFAMDQVFKNDRNIQSIRASSSALSDYIGKALINAGFRVIEQAGKIGVFRWKITVYELTRVQWETKRSG